MRHYHVFFHPMFHLKQFLCHGRWYNLDSNESVFKYMILISSAYSMLSIILYT
jgi:hypothetical protein